MANDERKLGTSWRCQTVFVPTFVPDIIAAVLTVYFVSCAIQGTATTHGREGD